MRVIDPGHKYELMSLDGPDPVILTHVKRNNPPEKYPGNTDCYPGTTTQEVLAAEIDRLKYIRGQQWFPENEVTLFHLRMAYYSLEVRAARTHGRFLSIDPLMIETYPKCYVCGHLQPETHDHSSTSI